MKDLPESILGLCCLLFIVNIFTPLGFSVNDIFRSKKEVPLKPYTCDVKGVGTVSGKRKDGIGVAIFAVEQTKIIGNYRAQGKYIVVSFAVSNDTKNSVSLQNQGFVLLDKHGNKYNCDSHVDWDLPRSANNINPGLTVGKYVAFDVPESLDVNSLTFQFNMGLFGANLTLPLKVQFAQ